MPIQYVGGNTGTWAGATSGNNTISLTALTGGIATSAAAGDLVIALYGTGSGATARTLSITDGTTAYTLIASQLFANNTAATNLRVAYKRLTTADTSVTFGPTGSTADAGAATVYVFRGVDTSIFDVTTTTATGTGIARPTPPPITPVTSGTFIVCIGAAAAGTGAVFTTATLTAFRSVTSADTTDAMVGVGYFAWTSGTYTPAQFSGGTTGTGTSWAAMSIALKESQPQTASITESVTATDSSSAVVPIITSTTESVTATDTSSNVLYKAPYNVGVHQAKGAYGSSFTNTTAIKNGDTVLAAVINFQSVGGRRQVVIGGTTYTGVLLANEPSWAIAGLTTELSIIAFYNLPAASVGGANFTFDSTGGAPGDFTFFAASCLAISGITAATPYIASNTQGTSATQPTLTISGLNSTATYYTFGAVGVNGPTGDSFTQASGFATPFDRIGTTGGSATSNATVAGGWDLVSGITSDTYNPTVTSRDWAEVMVVFNVTPSDTETVLESVTATDSATRTAIFRPTITESVTAVDSQVGGNVTSSTITESVTATDSQNGGLSIVADITETVSATDAQDYAYLANATITESVTSEDSSSAVAVFNIWATDSGLVGGNPGSGVSAASLNTANTVIGQTFTANTSGYISGFILRVARFNTANPLPTQPGTVELWQLASASITSQPTTLITSTTFNLADLSTSSALVQFVFTPNTALISSGNAYAVMIRAGSDWNLASTQTLLAYQSSTLTVLSDIVNTPFVRGVSGTGPTYTISTISRKVIGTIAVSQIDDTQLGGFVAAADITETVTTTDAQDALLTYNVATTETVSAADTQDAIVTIDVSNAETATATDSQTAIFTTSVSITESVTATDSENAAITFTSDTTETLTATDSEDVTLSTNASNTETVTATETQNVVASTYNASITESVSATDTYIGFGGVAYDGGSFAFGPFASAAIADANTNYSAISTQGAVVYLTGVSGTVQQGTAVATTSYAALVTGLEATTELGTVAVAARGIYEGGAFAFGSFASAAIADANTDYTDIQTQGVEVYLTTVAGTGQTGTLNATGTSNTNVTGVSGTGQIGDEATSSDANVYVSGEQATGFTGTVTTTATSNVYPTTVTGTGQTGTLTMTGAANVTLTGVQGIGAVGTVTVTAAATANATGVFGTGQTGTVTTTAAANVFPTSVTGTGQTGTLTMTGAANVTLTGVQATGYIGQTAVATQDIITGGMFAFGAIAASAIADANTNYDQIETQGVEVYLTTVTGTGQTGTVSFFAEANVNVTGVSGTGQIGDEATSSDANVYVVGEQATGFTGTVTMTGAANVPLTGVVGTGQTGNVEVNGDNNIAVTGVFATGVVPQRDTTNGGTFALGPIASAPIADAYEPIPEVIGTAGIDVTGVVGTGETGTLTMTGDSNVYPIGVSGAGQIGDESTSSDANVYVSGVQATGQTGTVVVIGAANVYPLGVVGTLILGTVTTAANADVPVTGVSGTAQEGTITMTGTANVYPTGVQATGQIGNVIIESGYLVTGVQATAYVGTVVVWSDINDNQNPNWQAINDSQLESWADVDDAQASNWQNVDDNQTNNWEEVDDGNTIVWKQVVT